MLLDLIANLWKGITSVTIKRPPSNQEFFHGPLFRCKMLLSALYHGLYFSDRGDGYSVADLIVVLQSD